MAYTFKEPIYITRPLLPDLKNYTEQLRQIWDAKWLSNSGAKHMLLENKIKELLKVPYLSLFNNGTAALLIAVKILKLSGEVITTPFTFPATPHVLTWNKIEPIFCDIDPVTMNLDAGKVEDKITKKTTAILAVHVFGTPCDVKQLQEIADTHKLKIIYDAAHAFQAEIDDKGIGTFGDLSVFSFHPTKLFHTAEGGALACNSLELKEDADLLKNFGILNEEEVITSGINGKMNEVQAALGLEVLNMLNDERNKREKISELYSERLSKIEGIDLPLRNQNVSCRSYQYYAIRINEAKFGKSRDEVYAKLKKYNIFARKYFYPLCSNYPHYRASESANKNNLVYANQVSDEVLVLPFYGGLSMDDVSNICDIFIEIRGSV